MAQYRKYTKAQKAEAVGIAEIEGQTAAAEVTGIPLTTLNQWYHRPEFVELRTKTREDVERQFWVAIQVGLKAVVEGLDKGKLSEKAIALGVLYDKYALMTGGATGRMESRDITGTISDAELVAAVAEADRIATGNGTETPTEGASAGEL